MKSILVKAMRSYLQGNIEKHVANVRLHLSNTVGVAEHPDHIETIEKELGIIAEFEDKLSVLEKYFGTGDKGVING
tara:strand:+ start:2038 stop:2265 length:228 start_codon:yes stop_codon:yes gene_type:complete